MIAPRHASDRALAGELWRLAWPAISHMVLLTLVLLVDRALLGRFSSTALASMQISGTLVWTIYSLFSASSAGTLAVVGRRFGAGDLEGAADAARASLRFALALGCVVVAPLWLTMGPLLRWMFPTTEPEVMAEALLYLHLVLPVMPLAFLEATAAATLQATGDTRTPMKVAAAGGALNVALSATLIFGYLGAPRMGVAGAAIGTALALGLEGVVLVIRLYSPKSPLPMRACSPSSSALSAVLRISLPAFGERFVYHVGYLAFTAIIGLLGAVAMASNQALISLESICFLSADGFGLAAGALVAQKLGRDKPLEAARVGWLAVGLAVATLSSFGLLFAAIPQVLIAAFSSDPEIVRTASRALYVAAVAQPFMATASVLGMSLRGAGDTRSVLGATMFSALVVRISATYFFAITCDLGLIGVWMGSTLDWITRTLWLGVVYLRGRWRTALVAA